MLPRVLLGWLESYIAHDMAFRILVDLRDRLYRALERLAPGWLLDRRSGALGLIHPLLPLVLAPVLLLVATVPAWLLQLAAHQGQVLRERLGETTAQVVDAIQGMREAELPPPTGSCWPPSAKAPTPRRSTPPPATAATEQPPRLPRWPTTTTNAPPACWPAWNQGCEATLRCHLATGLIVAALLGLSAACATTLLSPELPHRTGWSLAAGLATLAVLAGRVLLWRAMLCRRLRQASESRCPAARLRAIRWQLPQRRGGMTVLSLFPLDPAPGSRPTWTVGLLPEQPWDGSWRQGDEVVVLGRQRAWSVAVVVAGGAVLLPAGPLASHRPLPRRPRPPAPHRRGPLTAPETEGPQRAPAVRGGL